MAPLCARVYSKPCGYAVCRAQPQPVSQGHPAPEAAAAAQQAQQQQRRRVIEDENTIVVKGISYTKLECVGRGGSSKVGWAEGLRLSVLSLGRLWWRAGGH